MALERIVFHCTDRDLFGSFIRGLPRRVLTEPLRASAALKTRHFRGYRISKDRPDATAIAGAYYKEINVERNDQLLFHLCHNWLLTHQALVQQAFTALDLRDIDLQRTNDWLGAVHAMLSQGGHIKLGREVVRVLASGHELQDILTVVSILSVEYNDQTRLRKELEEEFRAVHDDPQVLHRALSSQVEELTVALKGLEDQTISDHKATLSELQRLRTELGAALLRRRPKGLLPAARQELLDPSKVWWGGRRGRLADRPRYSISVSLGVVPLVLPRRGSPSTHRSRGWLRSTRSFRTASAPTQFATRRIRARAWMKQRYWVAPACTSELHHGRGPGTARPFDDAGGDGTQAPPCRRTRPRG